MRMYALHTDRPALPPGPTAVHSHAVHFRAVQDSMLDMLAAQGGRFSLANLEAHGGAEAVCALPQVGEAGGMKGHWYWHGH